MLSWAVRYLVVAVAVAVAIGFAALQGGDWLEPPKHVRAKNRSVAANPAREATAQRARRTTAERAPSEDWAEQDAVSDDGWRDDSGWTDDEGWVDDNGWAEDDGWSNNDAWDGDQSGVMPEQPADGLLELVIRAGPHGHFVVEAEVDGTPTTS